MANCVQHSLQTTRNNRAEKKGTRAAQRQWSRAERCTVHGARRVCGRRSHNAHSSWEVSRGCRSSPNCSSTLKVLMLRRCPGENTAQTLPPPGQSSAQAAFAECTNTRARPFCAVLMGACGRRSSDPLFLCGYQRVVDGDSLSLQLTHSPTTG